jgi:RNA-directed DNA polymerase
LNLVTQYLMRTAKRGGNFWHYRQGIPLGCALSPLVGAFFLAELDRELERNGFFFNRDPEDNRGKVLLMM